MKYPTIKYDLRGHTRSSSLDLHIYWQEGSLRYRSKNPAKENLQKALNSLQRVNPQLRYFS